MPRRRGPCAALIEFRVLGPIEAIANGHRLPLEGKLNHALLASLLIHAGVVRTADQLIDDLWSERAPATARRSLHNIVSSLRRAIGHELIQTKGTGYVLAVDGEQIDAVRFERLLARSRREHGEEKARTLEEAVALWRGSPLLDVRYESFAQGEIQRLEELHVSVLEELVETKLELGKPEAVVAELKGLVAGFPFRERLRMQLMVALHQCGRSVEALAAYLDWRRTLVETWGIEPSRAIQQVCDDIRMQAPYLEVAGRR